MSYETHASDLVRFYESLQPDAAQALALRLKQGARVLDVGSGSGRDAAWLASRGFEVCGAEPSDAMRAEALECHPELEGKLCDAGLPRLVLPWQGPFDGVLCNAAIQHLRPGDLIPAWARLKELTAPGGVLLVIVPTDYPVNNEGLDDRQRYFNLQPPAFWKDLALHFGFVILSAKEGADTRPGRKWLTLELRREGGDGLGALEVLASVLGRDKKTTSYKFALLRALAELAMSGRAQTGWKDDCVLVPLDAISRLWLEYYYPLVNAPVHLSQGRQAEGKADISFRGVLEQLGGRFEPRGGLFALKRELTQRPDDDELAKAIRMIRDALVKGPVNYTGNPATGGKIFAAEAGFLMVPAALWTELGRFSTWVRDAVILRWAEYTKEVSQESAEIKTGDVLDLLLPQEAKRTQKEYRDLIRQSLEYQPESLWSPAKIRDTFHIDHIIPFSLWGNNDLWNLGPVTVKENSDKSDKLPSLALLGRSRERLGSHWAFLDQKRTGQFRAEAAQTLGVKYDFWSRPAANDLFDALVAAVEMTAQGSGVQRWDGSPPA